MKKYLRSLYVQVQTIGSTFLTSLIQHNLTDGSSSCHGWCLLVLVFSQPSWSFSFILHTLYGSTMINHPCNKEIWYSYVPGVSPLSSKLVLTPNNTWIGEWFSNYWKYTFFNFQVTMAYSGCNPTTVAVLLVCFHPNKELHSTPFLWIYELVWPNTAPRRSLFLFFVQKWPD